MPAHVEQIPVYVENGTIGNSMSHENPERIEYEGMRKGEVQTAARLMFPPVLAPDLGNL